jgi:hypothetical protein
MLVEGSGLLSVGEVPISLICSDRNPPTGRRRAKTAATRFSPDDGEVW